MTWSIRILGVIWMVINHLRGKHSWIGRGRGSGSDSLNNDNLPSLIITSIKLLAMMIRHMWWPRTPRSARRGVKCKSTDIPSQLHIAYYVEEVDYSLPAITTNLLNSSADAWTCAECSAILKPWHRFLRDGVAVERNWIFLYLLDTCIFPDFSCVNLWLIIPSSLQRKRTQCGKRDEWKRDRVESTATGCHS